MSVVIAPPVYGMWQGREFLILMTISIPLPSCLGCTITYASSTAEPCRSVMERVYSGKTVRACISHNRTKHSCSPYTIFLLQEVIFDKGLRFRILCLTLFCRSRRSFTFGTNAVEFLWLLCSQLFVEERDKRITINEVHCTPTSKCRCIRHTCSTSYMDARWTFYASAASASNTACATR